MEVRTITSVACQRRTQSSVISELTSVFLIGAEELFDLLADLALRDLDIILGIAVLRHERKKAVVRDVKLARVSHMTHERRAWDTHELVLLASDVGNIHVVGGGAQFLELFTGEDIKSDQMDLGVAVLSSLGSGHIDDFAGAVLDHHESVLAQGRALHREGSGSASIGAFERVLML